MKADIESMLFQWHQLRMRGGAWTCNCDLPHAECTPEKRTRMYML